MLVQGIQFFPLCIRLEMEPMEEGMEEADFPDCNPRFLSLMEQMDILPPGLFEHIEPGIFRHQFPLQFGKFPPDLIHRLLPVSQNGLKSETIHLSLPGSPGHTPRQTHSVR